MFVALDIETTGLPSWHMIPLHDKPNGQMTYCAPHILEVAAVGLDKNFGVLGRIQLCVQPAPYALECMPAEVREMHRESMLLDDLKNAQPIAAVREAWAATLADWQARTGCKRFFAIGKNAGSFDIPILRSWGFATPFHHRVLDVGTLGWRGGEVPTLVVGEGRAHRAFDDTAACVALCHKHLDLIEILKQQGR